MSLPDKCPTCLRADRNSPASILRSLERDVETWQAEADRLAARLAELEARCKRLEEAGDFMAYNENVDFETLVAAWTKAKEAKP